MDIGTLGGLILAMGLIAASIPMAGVPITSFIDVASLLIVVGGVAAAQFVHFTLADIIRMLQVLPVAFQTKQLDPVPVVNKLIEMTDQGVKRGATALEGMAQEIPDPFFRRGMVLVAGSVPEEQIRYALETELEFTELRHGLGEAFFMGFAAYGPAFGMLGTLIGLVAMLRGLGGGGGVEAIGSGMAVALITTFYGSIIANVFGLPLAGKLKGLHEQEYAYKRIIIEGVILVSQGIRDSLPPKTMGERLEVYLPPARRSEIQAGRGSA